MFSYCTDLQGGLLRYIQVLWDGEGEEGRGRGGGVKNKV
jgi:hypothetical protein